MKLSLILVLMAFSCQSNDHHSIPPSHALFTQLLRKYVSAEGNVNYSGFIKDSTAFNQYLNALSKNPPDKKKWSREEQMAYWINVYNAYTIKLIARYYPLTSIKDIGSKIQIPFINTPWDIKFVRIGDQRMDLNNIEHGILRKEFADPRIHMALVCASKSCPVLLNEAYEAASLDSQLSGRAKAFLGDNRRNKIAAERAEISMIFKWYESDFNKNGGSVLNFINQFGPTKINRDTEISYMEYNWALNE